jgi:POT family proton-dependent oligopeptide transporter
MADPNDPYASSPSPDDGEPAGSGGGKTFFGHPRGLATLFFTEMWERFSYYGMRALLTLFMIDAIATVDEPNGGMALDETTAGAIYGLYTFGVYALALPGGWIADRLVGQKNAVLWGGIVIAVGHYVLAIPNDMAFFTGLGLVAIGTGLLKPNVSSIVGDLYPEGGARRDAGFSIFYMGINVGAVLGPFICSSLGEGIFGWGGNWHFGFGAAGVGMTLALVQYVLGAKHLAGVGDLKPEAAEPARRAQGWKAFSMGIGAVVVLTGLLIGLSYWEVLPITLVGFAQTTGIIMVVLAVIYFGSVIAFGCRDTTERKRVGMIALLFLGAAMFWSGFEQAGTSLTIYTDAHTQREFFGFEVPVGWFQNINPLFIIILAPVVGGLWVKLGARNPSIGMKFALGLLLLGTGFFVLAWGASFIDPDKPGMTVSPMWLVVTYFFHTVGELCLSPVGLSSITKLAPPRLVGQMMGTWFLGAALGNLIAGLVSGYIEDMPMATLFSSVGTIAAITGVVFVMLSGPMRRLTGGIK